MAEKEDPTVDANALNLRIQELEAQKNTWMGKATDYEKRFKGVDPDEFHANRTALEQLQRDKALADPKQMDSWKKETETQIRNSVQKELDTALSQVKEYSSRVKELEVVDTVFKDIAETFNTDCFDEVKQYIRRFCDKDEKGGIVIKDEQGGVRYAPGSTSKPMTPAEFGAWIGSLKPSWKKPTHVRGTENGTQTKGTGSNGAITAKEFMQLPAAEQRALAQKMSSAELSSIGKEVSRLMMG